MTLREEAERAAREILRKSELAEDGAIVSGYEWEVEPNGVALLADAIERVARHRIEIAVRSLFESTRIGSPHAPDTATLIDPRRETATNASGEIIGPNYFSGWLLNVDTGRWPLTVDDFVRVAIAAAEKGE